MNALKILCLLLVVSPVASVQPTHAQRLANGNLGYAMYYSVDSPSILKVGENTSVVLRFTTGTSSKLYVESLWVQIYGAGIDSSNYGISKLLLEDTELDPSYSFNETLVVKPLKEGTIACMLSTSYNWADLHLNTRKEWSIVSLYMEARANTYDGLLASKNTLQSLAYILSITTIIFIGATTYLTVQKIRTKKTE